MSKGSSKGLLCSLQTEWKATKGKATDSKRNHRTQKKRKTTTTKRKKHYHSNYILYSQKETKFLVVIKEIPDVKGF